LNSNLDRIKNANRSPVDNVRSEIEGLNNVLKQNEIVPDSFNWTLGSDEMGPCLEALIKFDNVKSALSFAQSLYDLQEIVDHHTNCVIDNFLTVIIKISTHQPVPAITHVDVLFAAELANLFNAPKFQPI